MRIICYFINFNDSFYLPFLAKHYGKFCEKIIMYDNYSTDGSRKLAEELGFEVRVFGLPGVLNDQHYLDVKNQCWKEQIGKDIDYVIVVDADEFVVVGDELINKRMLGEELDSAPTVQGFNMISEQLPVGDVFEIKTGSPSESYSKQAIFNPDQITEINYIHGCHRNRMTGRITTGSICRLFHYRQIGGVQRLIDRHAMYRPRLSTFNLKHRMGHHYGTPKFTPTEIMEFNEGKRKEWEILTAEAKELW